MKAKAAIFREIGEGLSIEEIEVDDPAPDEVRVRTVACGICHSDLHFMKGSIAGPRAAVPGHEPAGVVEAVGTNVRSVKEGDHVIACTSMFCGTCKQCMLGRPHLCSNRAACRRRKGDRPASRWAAPHQPVRRPRRLRRDDAAHERAVVAIDDDLPLDRASLVGCGVTTGVGAALNTARSSRARRWPCSAAVASASRSSRAPAWPAPARSSPSTSCRQAGHRPPLRRHRHAASPRRGHPVRAIKRLSGGGVDYAFDAVGTPPSRAQCLYALAPRGSPHRRRHPPGPEARGRARPLLPGEDADRVDHGLQPLPHRHPDYLELYRQGKLDLDAMISARVGLGEIDGALAAMEAGEVTRSVIMFDS